MKRLRMKLMNQSKKPLKGKRRHKMFPRDKVELHQKQQSTLKKPTETKIPKPEKKQQESSSKTKKLKKRLIVIPRHQKWLQGPAVD